MYAHPIRSWWYKAKIGKLWPLAKSGSPLDFVNKVLFKHTHAQGDGKNYIENGVFRYKKIIYRVRFLRQCNGMKFKV